MILLRSADWETQYASVYPSQGKIQAVDLHKLPSRLAASSLTIPRQPIAVQIWPSHLGIGSLCVRRGELSYASP